MQAALLPAVQVVWWFLPTFSFLCLYPFSLPVVTDPLNSPTGTAQGMSQNLRLLDMIVNPFIAREAKRCCYRVWEGARELASLPQLLVLLKSQCDDSHVLRWSVVAVAVHMAPEVLAASSLCGWGMCYRTVP